MRHSSMKLFIVASLAIFVLGSCTAKYQNRLHLVNEDGRTILKPKESFYVENMVISSPFTDIYYRAGKGHLAALAYSIKDAVTTAENAKNDVTQRHPRTDYRMILPLPEKITTGEVELDNSAFVRDFSTAELTIAERTFLFAGGTFSIDSIKSSDLYTSLNAVFRSLKGDSLTYDGQMKFIIRDSFSFRGTIYHRLK